MEQLIVGNISWLRNDYLSDITVGRITYPTVEHAYQASKFEDVALRKTISESALKVARKIGNTNPVREKFNREASMETFLRLKFNDPELGDLLANTGADPIIMEGYDDFWGTGRIGNGQNILGKILESIRSELQILRNLEDDENSPPSLKDAILNSPDEELADLLQKLLNVAKEVLALQHPTDLDTAFISKHTGLSLEDVRKAQQTIVNFGNTIEEVDALLSSEGDSEDECDGGCDCCGCCEDDEDEDEEYLDEDEEDLDEWEDDDYVCC